MDSLNKKPFYSFLIITPLVLVLFLILPLLGLLLTVLSAGILLAHRFHLPLTQSLVLSVFLLISYIGTFEFVVSIIYPYSPNFIALYSTLAVIFACLLLPLFSLENLALRKLLTTGWKDEIVTIIIAGLSTLFFAIPMIHPYDAAVSISFFSAGEDNASHFAMMNYGIESQRAPYFEKGNSGLLDTLNMYPQGIHSSFALFYNAAFDTDPSLEKKLLMYAASMLFSVFTLIYMMTSLCLRLLRKSSYRFLAAIFIATTSVLWFISQLVSYGFLSQVFAYALLFCLVLVVQNKKNLISQKNTSYFITISLFLILGIVFSWYLLAPIAALIVFLPYYHTVVKQRSKLAMALIVIAVLISIGVVVCNTSGAASGSVITPGAVYGFEPWVYWLAVGVVGVYSIYRLVYSRSNVTPFDILAYSSTGLALLIGIYQLVTVNEFRYYYFKFMYLVLLVALVIIALFLTRIKDAKAERLAPYISLFLVVYLFSYLATVQPGNIRSYINEEYPRSFQATDIRPVLQEGSFSVHSDAVFIGNCPAIKKYMLNRWAGALYLSEDKTRSRLYGRTFKSPDRFDEFYATYAHRHDQVEISSPNCRG